MTKNMLEYGPKLTLDQWRWLRYIVNSLENGDFAGWKFLMDKYDKVDNKILFTSKETIARAMTFSLGRVWADEDCDVFKALTGQKLEKSTWKKHLIKWRDS